MGHQIRPASTAFSPACIPASLSRDLSPVQPIGGMPWTPVPPATAGRAAWDGPTTLQRLRVQPPRRTAALPARRSLGSPGPAWGTVPSQPHEGEEAAGTFLGPAWEPCGAAWLSGMLAALAPAEPRASPCRAGAPGRAGLCLGSEEGRTLQQRGPSLHAWRGAGALRATAKVSEMVMSTRSSHRRPKKSSVFTALLCPRRSRAARVQVGRAGLSSPLSLPPAPRATSTGVRKRLSRSELWAAPRTGLGQGGCCR